jgi:hypothetical protein
MEVASRWLFTLPSVLTWLCATFFSLSGARTLAKRPAEDAAPGPMKSCLLSGQRHILFDKT